jgi:thiol-activated cytolysin
MRTSFIAAALLASGASLGCSDPQRDPGSIEDEVNEESAPTDASDEVDSYLLGLPDLAIQEVVAKTEIDCDGECPSAEQDGDQFCSYKRFTETAQYDQFVALQPNSATLWPGVVVRGADAENGVLTPVGVDLAPVTFSVSLENISGSPVGHMDAPSLSAFREQQNAILSSGVTGATPASLTFEVVQINSSSQLGVELGAEVSWPGGPDVAASFDFSSIDNKTKVLVNFTQAYYTVDVDTPSSPSDFFVDGVTVDDLLPWTSVEDPPLYVQSITYGRRVIFSVQTSRSAQEVKAALEASYSAVGVANGGIDVATEHKEVLSESTIRAFVLGGSGDDATGAINGFDGLVSYIQNGGSYSKDSPGAPIAYKLAYLDNAVTRLAFTTDYTERQCVKNMTTLHVGLDAIQHVSGGDPGSNLELYGQIVVRYPTADSPVVDCNTGGKLAWIWDMPDGSWISVAEGATYTPTSVTAVDLHDVPTGPGQRICLIADMWEEDGATGELTADDDFGIAGNLIEFDDGWGGEHHVVTHGTADNSLDVAFTVELN